MEKNSNSKFITIVAAVFLIGFAFFILKTLQDILLPFFIAVIIAFMFQPLYAWLKSKKIPGWGALIIVMLIIIMLSNISSLFILTSIGSFQEALPKYEVKFNELINGIFYQLNLLGVDVQGLKDSMDMNKYIQDGTITNIVTGLLSSVVGIFGDFVLILIYVVFLLSEFGSIKRRIMVAFSPEKAGKIASLIGDVFHDVRKYIVGKTLINIVHASVITFILWCFGIDFYLVWGFLTFLMNYIPNIGSIIATVMPFLTALLKYDDFVVPIILLAILIVVGNTFGNFLEPKIFGDNLDLSPILILFSLIFWGYVWGIMGMILSVPIMSMIKIVLMKFDTTRPIAILMSYNLGSLNRVKKRKGKNLTEATE